MTSFRVKFHNKEIPDLAVEATSVDCISDDGASFYVFSNDGKDPMGESLQAIVNLESVLYIRRVSD
ncbi:MAG TPA: hypothetical protein VIY48_17715 [Candidatus Paceibacterota bacterium]